jgi:hypothetical protein
VECRGGGALHGKRLSEMPLFSSQANNAPRGTPNLPALNSGQDYRINTTPYMMQYNLNIQGDIGWGSIVTIGYVGSAGVHLMANREENPPTPVIDSNGVYHFADLVNGAIVPHPKLNPLVGPLPIKRADGHSNCWYPNWLLITKGYRFEPYLRS